MRDFRNLSVEDWWQLFWRRKWYFVVISVLVASGTITYAMRLSEIYRSETRIMVEAAAIPEDYVRPLVRTSAEERINAIRAQLQGRNFLQQIVEDFQLFGFGSRKDFVMEDAIQALRGNIKVETSVGNIFTLSYQAPDAQFARDVTQRLAQSLIQSNLSAGKDRVDRTEQFIDEQLSQIEKDLTAQEDKIRQFKTIHLGELPEQSMVNINNLSALNTQLALAENALQQAKDRRKLLDYRLQEQKRLDNLARNLFIPESTPAPEAKGSVPVALNCGSRGKKGQARRAEVAVPAESS